MAVTEEMKEVAKTLANILPEGFRSGWDEEWSNICIYHYSDLNVMSVSVERRLSPKAFKERKEPTLIIRIDSWGLRVKSFRQNKGIFNWDVITREVYKRLATSKRLLQMNREYHAKKEALKFNATEEKMQERLKYFITQCLEEFGKSDAFYEMAERHAKEITLEVREYFKDADELTEVTK